MNSQIVAMFLIFSVTCVVSGGAVNFNPRLSKLKDYSVIEVLKHGHSLALEVYKSWNETLAETADRTLSENSDGVELLKRIVDLSSQIKGLDVRVRMYAQETIGILLRELPLRLRLELRLDALSDMMTKVNVASDQLQRYLEYNTEGSGTARVERHTIQELAEWAVSHRPDSAMSLTERIHRALVPTDDGPLGRGVLKLLANALVDPKKSICDMQQSPQQLLYNIYSSVAVADLRGYALMQFSWMLLRHYGKGNFTLEARLMRERHRERSAQKTEAVRTAMESARRDMHRCDPVEHLEGETFEQLTRLLQGHIENEVDINSGGGCWQNCAYYPHTKSYDCYMDEFCARQPQCEGTLHDCTFYDSDMWVCQDESPGGRRYDWVEYEDGTLLGEKGPCLNGTTKVDSWWRWLFWHCSYCLCLCDQRGPHSDRYFSLRPVVVDVRNNSVVTGVRLTKHGRAIHLQISEAPLLPLGAVGVPRWQPVGILDVDGGEAVDGRDYHTMDYDHRAVDLDEAVAPSGHVLTGVRFQVRDDHLTLEIMATRFDFATGVLSASPGDSVWVAPSLSGPRTPLALPPSDVPTRSPSPSVLDSRPGQFATFAATGAVPDASQTTVPFLDAQPVSPVPPTLLSGAGLYHKGRPGYGGFVAPMLVTYDYSPHLGDAFE